MPIVAAVILRPAVPPAETQTRSCSLGNVSMRPVPHSTILTSPPRHAKVNKALSELYSDSFTQCCPFPIDIQFPHWENTVIICFDSLWKSRRHYACIYSLSHWFVYEANIFEHLLCVRHSARCWWLDQRWQTGNTQVVFGPICIFFGLPNIPMF